MLLYKLGFDFTFLFYSYIFVFFFNDTATTEIYTLSLHDALPIFGVVGDAVERGAFFAGFFFTALCDGLLLPAFERPHEHYAPPAEHRQRARRGDQGVFGEARRTALDGGLSQRFDHRGRPMVVLADDQVHGPELPLPRLAQR